MNTSRPCPAGDSCKRRPSPAAWPRCPPAGLPTTVLADAWARETGGSIEVTAAPHDQLTSKQILDVQGGSG